MVERPPGEVERVERRPRDVVDEQGGGVEGTEERCSGEGAGEKDALIAMSGSLHGMPLVVVAFEFNFHGGSMGYAVGEKFTRAAQVARCGAKVLVSC